MMNRLGLLMGGKLQMCVSLVSGLHCCIVDRLASNGSDVHALSFLNRNVSVLYLALDQHRLHQLNNANLQT